MNIQGLPDQSFRNGREKYIPSDGFKTVRVAILEFIALSFGLWISGAIIGAIVGKELADIVACAFAVCLIGMPFVVVYVFYSIVSEKIKTIDRYGQTSLFGSKALPKIATVIFGIFGFAWYKYFGAVDIWTLVVGYIVVFFVCDLGLSRECEAQNAFEYVEFFEKEYGIFIPNPEKIKSTEQVMQIVKTVRIDRANDELRYK